MDKPADPATSGGGSISAGPPPGTRRFKTADITSKRVRKPEAGRSKGLFAVGFAPGQASSAKPLVPPASAGAPTTAPATPAASALAPPPPTTAHHPATVLPATPTPVAHTPKLTAHPPLPHPRLPALPRWPASLRSSSIASSPPASASAASSPSPAPATAAPAVATSSILSPAPRTPLHLSARPEVPTPSEASAPPFLPRPPAAADLSPIRATMPQAQGLPYSPITAVVAPTPSSPKPPQLPPTSSITPPPLTSAPPASIVPTVQPPAPAPTNSPMPSAPSAPTIEANSALPEERQVEESLEKGTPPRAATDTAVSCTSSAVVVANTIAAIDSTTKAAISGVVGPAVATPPGDLKRPVEQSSAAAPTATSYSAATDPNRSKKVAGAELPPKLGAGGEQATAKHYTTPPTTSQADVEAARGCPNPAAAVTKSLASTTHCSAPVSPSVHSYSAANGTHAGVVAATAEAKLGPSATESDAVAGLAQVAATSVAATTAASPTGSPTRKRRILTTKMAKVLAQEKATAKRVADLQDLRDKRRALNSTAAVVVSASTSTSAAAPSTKKVTPASRRLSMLERLDSEQEAQEREERNREERNREERRKTRERLEKATRAGKEARAAQERAKDADEKREAAKTNEKAKEEGEEKKELEVKEKEKAAETDTRDERASRREQRNDDNPKEMEKAARKTSVHATARERERASKREAKEQAKREREAKQARRQLRKNSKQSAAAATKKDEPQVEAKKAAVLVPATNEEDEVDESLTSSTVQGGTMMLATPIMGDSQQPPGSRDGLAPLSMASALSPSSSSSTSTPSAFKTYSRPTNPPPFTLILPLVNGNLPQPPATATVQQPSVVVVPDSKLPVPSASYSMVPIDAPLAGGTIEHKADDAIELPPSATVAAVATVAPRRRGRPKKCSAAPAAEPPVKRKRSVGRSRTSASAGPATPPAAEKPTGARATKRRRADSQGRGLTSASDDSRSGTPVTIATPASTPPHSWPLSPATSSSAASLSTKSKPRAARASGGQVRQAAAAGQQASEADLADDDEEEKESAGKNEKQPKKRRKESGDEQKKKKKREGAQTSGRQNRTSLKALHKRRRLTPVSMDESPDDHKPEGPLTAGKTKGALAGISTPSSPSPSSSRPASPTTQAKAASGTHAADGEEQFPELEKMLDGFTTLLDSTARPAQGVTTRKSPTPSPVQLALPPRPSIPIGGLEEGYQGFLATCTDYFDAKQQRDALASPQPPPLQSPQQSGPLSPPAVVITTGPAVVAPAPIVVVMSPAADDPQAATSELPTITDERATEGETQRQFFRGMDGGREGEGSPPELGMQLGANLSSSDSGGSRSHLVSPFSDILREFNIDASDVQSGGGGGAYKQPHHSHHAYVHQQQHHTNYFGLPTSPLDMFMVHPHEQDPFAELSGGYAPFLSFPADDVSPYYSPALLPHGSGEKTPSLGDLVSKSGDGSHLPVLVTSLDAVDVLASGKTYSHNISDSRRVPTPTPTLDPQSHNVTGNGRLTPTSAAAPTPSPYSGQRLPTAALPFRATPPSGAHSSPHDDTNCLHTLSGSGSAGAASPHPSGSSGQNVESHGSEHRIRFYVQLRKGNETVPIRVNKGLTFSGLKKLGMEHWGVKAMSPKLFRVYDRHGAFTVGRDLVVNEAVSNECFTLVQLSDDSATGDSIGDDGAATN